MRVVVHRLADNEIDKAAKHYKAVHPTLMVGLLSDIDGAIGAIVERPDAWPAAGWGARKRRLSRYPYRIVYISKSDTIHVIAFMHVRRKPGYWRRRKPPP